ncbi:ArsR/SmtB family transcription factor [Flexivirga meconopsidis]|uniref:ArsR/SmtB family transcription factor n=1 Tax=Flexivirga meconopsidis TaxID=2977121 RepID=UPI00224005D1|nr:helix-turn-helix domain-containing protein [Flexivirga meconopsidis]
MANPYGDVELDAKGMRALAHPVRLAILAKLNADGPSTATALAPDVGATPSVTSWHLRHLAEHGLVRDSDHPGSGRERWWEATSRGYRMVVTDDESATAQTALLAATERTEGDLVGRWREDDEPRLPLVWRKLAGRANTTILLSADELAELEAAWEQLLAPYVRRKSGDGTIPGDARPVRMLLWTMPSASDDD